MAEESKSKSKSEESKTQTQSESPFIQSEVLNRVVIPFSKSNRRLSFYVERARLVLRSEESCIVTGAGRAIANVCTMVEILKRQKVAVIKKCDTQMSVHPVMIGPSLDWRPPMPVITFELGRGEHAQYVTDFRQRRVIELFEKNDAKQSGVLSKDVVRGLALTKAFYANEAQVATANKFLDSIKGNDVNLPDFIKFASLCIPPLLKNSVFRDSLFSHYSIGVGSSDSKGTDKDADGDADAEADAEADADAAMETAG